MLVLERPVWEASLEPEVLVDVATMDMLSATAAVVQVDRQVVVIGLVAAEATEWTLVVVTDSVVLSRSNFQLCCSDYRHDSAAAVVVVGWRGWGPLRDCLCRSDRLLRGRYTCESASL